LAFCLAPAFICSIIYVSECRTTLTTSKAKPGRPTKPRPTVSGAQPTFFEAKKISKMLGKVGALLIGVGIGVGVGLLIAPASGEETRADIVDEVSAFGEKVSGRKRKPQRATGTHGE
jgi:hypothetical protein